MTLNEPLRPSSYGVGAEFFLNKETQMTPNEQLHALLLAFNDAVKKLVHDAVEQTLKNAVVQKVHEDGYYYSHYKPILQFDHPSHSGVVIHIGEPVETKAKSNERD